MAASPERCAGAASDKQMEMARMFRFAKFNRAEEGATAIEFALVAAPLFFLIGCILEIGIMLFTEYALQNAVQEAGRLVRTAQATSSSAFTSAICDEAPNLQNCPASIGFRVDNAATFTDLEAVVPGLLTIEPGTTLVFNPGAPKSAVAVNVTYDWTFIFPFLQPLSNIPAGNARRLRGTAVFQNEPAS